MFKERKKPWKRLIVCITLAILLSQSVLPVAAEAELDPNLAISTNYSEGRTVIWEVDINTSAIGQSNPLTHVKPGAVLTDILPPTLALDTNQAVSLYPVNRPSVYSEYVISGNAIQGGSTNYESSSRSFTYTLPQNLDTSGSYRLIFATEVVRLDFYPIQNSISMNTSTGEKQVTSDPVYIRNAGLFGGLY